MLNPHIGKLLRNNLNHEPTKSQQELFDLLGNFLTSDDQRVVLVVKGYAGTGKTTVVSSLVKTMEQTGQQYVLLAPTGRAAKVLANYSRRSASTIHKRIYRQKREKEGIAEFSLDRNLLSDAVFIVDEASMITDHSSESSIFGSGRLLNDLIRFVYNNRRCKMILIGDTAQLPPVGISLSPALDPDVLSGYGLSVKGTFLRDIVRHSVDSGILFNATRIRENITRNMLNLPVLQTGKYEDMEAIPGTHLAETIDSAYGKYGENETIVVTRSNYMANKYNQGIRNSILWREEEICRGDRIMVVRNNYFWINDYEEMDFIANGDIAEVVGIHEYQERYGYRFADVSLKMPDYNNLEFEAKIILDTLKINTSSLSGKENQELYFKILEDHPEAQNRNKRSRILKEHPFYNALQVKFAYAVTCHKAQGGQWKAVFIDQGAVRKDMMDIDYLRWMYTALTRGTTKVYLVNFPGEFLDTFQS